MKKTIFLIGIFLLIGLKINAQELTCEDFKIGQFYIPETPEMAKYTIVENDSISEFTPERDKTIKNIL